jgi:endogenous inhibitor of DNA gyrase (YacG/DUF329 family)
MAKKRVHSLRCPTCRKVVLRTDPEFPFCSDRCRLIDLGKWASGGYVISTPIDRGDESGEADYTTGRARPVRGPGNCEPRKMGPNGQDHEDINEHQKRG